jgi:hypothetical protein
VDKEAALFHALEHKGRDLPGPILRAIIKQSGLTVEEFTALL